MSFTSCFIGGFEFLIIILLGLIINTVNVIVLTQKKTPYTCYQTYLLSNTVNRIINNIIKIKKKIKNRI